MSPLPAGPGEGNVLSDAIEEAQQGSLEQLGVLAASGELLVKRKDGSRSQVARLEVNEKKPGFVDIHFMDMGRGKMTGKTVALFQLAEYLFLA